MLTSHGGTARRRAARYPPETVSVDYPNALNAPEKRLFRDPGLHFVNSIKRLFATHVGHYDIHTTSLATRFASISSISIGLVV